MSFITAFPENIAYFHQKVLNYLKITCLIDYTEVTITYVGEVDEGNSTKRVLDKAGVTWTWNLAKEIEVSRLNMSNKTILISSNQTITVLSMSGWPGTFLSHVVQPYGNLGTVYHVPTLNYTELVASFGFPLNGEPRYNSFRLLIINAVNQTNTVTIQQVNQQGQRSAYKQTLNNFSLFQLQTNGDVTEINATDKVVVMFTHPCFDSKGCSCNMVLNQLRPTRTDNVSNRFYIPFNFTYHLSPIKQLFLTTNQCVVVGNGSFPNVSIGVKVMNSSDILPLQTGFSKASQILTTNKPVSLRIISPGLILDLIPDIMFSACNLVHFNSLNSEALVIAETSSTDSVWMNASALPPATKWTVINGSLFSWTIVKGSRANTSSTIWHTNSKISVYVIERLESDNIYGGPAIILSDEPDPKGCAVTSGMFVVGDEEMNWFRSRKYCQDNSDHFARPFRKQYLDSMVSNITALTPVEGWISLRRDLLTREWYWRSEDDFSPQVNFTYWEQGHPGEPEKGLCALVSLDPAKNFKWKSAHCCSNKKPVCYNNPKYFSVL